MDFERVIQNKLYKKDATIGIGTFGRVCKCIVEGSGSEFALKEINIEFGLIKYINNEITILKEIADHKNLVKFFGHSVEGNSILIFTEFMKNGSLRDVINKSGPFDEKQTAKYTSDCLEGLNFLHEHNVIHRDIKCGNILLGDDGNVKLTDFGLSKCVEDKSMLDNHTFCGTLFFMSPEVIQHNSYSSSADIWSLGVTIVEMMTGMPIYHKLTQFQFVLQITSPQEIDIGIPNASDELKYCLKLMFLKDPSKRPKSRDLLKCKFVINNES